MEVLVQIRGHSDKEIKFCESVKIVLLATLILRMKNVNDWQDICSFLFAISSLTIDLSLQYSRAPNCPTQFINVK
jgi:hypothetical protein